MPTERSDRLWTRLGGFAYGADYNPEQWDETTWERDIELMSRACINLVSLSIFGWASLEPRSGEFEFGWLDTIMQMLADASISVCLATATASPPPWLSVDHPETLPVAADGRQLWHGSRQHFCPSSPVYRQHAVELVRQLAGRYNDHPALAAWHVGNEYGCHVSRCYCDVSAADFRAWLERRYGDLNGLNRAWSTSFWSQHYSRWEEVMPPRDTPTFSNSAQEIDFREFSSDALLECFLDEVAVLRELTPDVPATTNFLGAHEAIDGFAWAAHQDFVSGDNYPDPADPEAAIGGAIMFDFLRGASGGARWLLLEQAPSAVNWRDVNTPKRPGLYRLWSWQAIARGAGGAMSFQWRASRGGSEKFHSAMVPHAGEDTAIFRGVEALGAELAAVAEVARSLPEPADAAIMMDWRNRWALEQPSHPSDRLWLTELVRAWYEPLWRATIAVDLVSPVADLSGYRIVFVPNAYLLSQAACDALSQYVRDGGHLVVGFFSGIVDESDILHPGAYPGGLRELIGAQVDQFWPLHPGEAVGVDLADGGEGTGVMWSEELVPVDAEVIARFVGGELDGRPAATRVRRGAGTASYLGTLPDRGTLARILGQALDIAGVSGVLPYTPEGVEATVRVTDDERFLFLLNHGSTPATVEISGRWRHVLGYAPDRNKVVLDAQSVVILRASR